MKAEEIKSSPKRKNLFFHFYPAIFILLWIFLFFVSLKAFSSTTDEDRQYYDQLIEQSDSPKESSSPSYQVQQHRFNINKHFLFTQGVDRLQLHLRSVNSELVFDQKQSDAELVEYFNDVNCLVQEKLTRSSSTDRPEQYIRYFEADSAIYSYKTKNLVAKEVKLSRYLVPGHEMPTSVKDLEPMMEGTARQVEWCLSNHETPLKIHGFQGSLQDLGGLP